MSTLDTTTSEAARTYAQALHTALVGNALQQLRAVAAGLRSGGDLATLAARIDQLLGAGAPVTLKNFLLAMASENDLELLPQVIEAFSSFSQAPAQQLDAEVTSAEALSVEQQQRIENDLRSRYGDGLVLRFTVDPSLIGGLIIRVGDRVVDNSLRTRLAALQRNMLAG